MKITRIFRLIPQLLTCFKKLLWRECCISNIRMSTNIFKNNKTNPLEVIPTITLVPLLLSAVFLFLGVTFGLLFGWEVPAGLAVSLSVFFLGIEVISVLLLLYLRNM